MLPRAGKTKTKGPADTAAWRPRVAWIRAVSAAGNKSAVNPKENMKIHTSLF